MGSDPDRHQCRETIRMGRAPKKCEASSLTIRKSLKSVKSHGGLEDKTPNVRILSVDII